MAFPVSIRTVDWTAGPRIRRASAPIGSIEQRDMQLLTQMAMPIPPFSPLPGVALPAAGIDPDVETVILPTGMVLEFPVDNTYTPQFQIPGCGAALQFHYDPVEGTIDEVLFYWARSPAEASGLLSNTELDKVQEILMEVRRSLPEMGNAPEEQKEYLARSVQQLQCGLAQHRAAKEVAVAEQARQTGQLVERKQKEDVPLEDLVSLLTLSDADQAAQKVEDMMAGLRI